MNRQTLIGGGLMPVGIVSFLPVLGADIGGAWNLPVVPAAILLTYGTYLVGTSGPDADDGSVA